jgi:ABC-type Fe3+/spermidine/putrescine transport system ATPase subunit
MSEIRVIDVSFAYGGRTVLDRVSFAIPEGSVFLILGPSGSGKTTLLRLIAGFLYPRAGEIRLDGRTVSSPDVLVPPRDRRIGMVFQSLALWPHLSARSHLRYAGQDAEGADAILRDVGLADLRRRRPDALSGGQRQRLAIARALAGRPRILLLDEPFAHLDPPCRLEANRVLRRLWDESRPTVCCVTHQPDDLDLPVSGCLLLEDGHILGPRPLDQLEELSDGPYPRVLRELRLRARGPIG